MDTVIDFIRNNYQLKVCEYIHQNGDIIADDDEVIIEKIIEKLTSAFLEDIQILKTETYADTRTSLAIIFSYKGYLGELESTYCSRGYDYWVIRFPKDDA